MGYDYDSCILEDGLKEELKCACCGDIFESATEIIPCGHNFCNDCLNQVNQNNSACPRKLEKITWRDVDVPAVGELKFSMAHKKIAKCTSWGKCQFGKVPIGEAIYGQAIYHW